MSEIQDSVELRLLAGTLVLAIVQLYWAWAAVRGQRKRERRAGDPPGPLKGNVGNVHRAFRNLMETLPIFSGAVILTVLMDRSSFASVVGAHVWFWGRVAYAPVYGFGLIWLRPWVWYFSMFGLFTLVANLFFDDVSDYVRPVVEPAVAAAQPMLDSLGAALAGLS